MVGAVLTYSIIQLAYLDGKGIDHLQDYAKELQQMVLPDKVAMPQDIRR